MTSTASSTPRSIAFLGTGIMGSPMAVHLLRAGHRVACYNRTRAKTQAVVAAGGTAHASAAEAAHGADVVISMVTDGPDVEAVWCGPGGAWESAAPGCLCIDMSTISPELTRRLAVRATERGLRTLDAPVTGGQGGAENATLTIMIGGDMADLEEARPLLQVLGRNLVHCGDHGAGQSVKLCNQICGAMNLLGVCEALLLGEKLGVAPEAIISAIGGGAASSWAMQNLAPRIVANDYAPGFMVDTQQKDMRLVAEAAEQAAVPLPGASLAQQLWRGAQAAGCGREGIQSMAKVLRCLAGD